MTLFCYVPNMLKSPITPTTAKETSFYSFIFVFFPYTVESIEDVYTVFFSEISNLSYCLFFSFHILWKSCIHVVWKVVVYTEDLNRQSYVPPISNFNSLFLEITTQFFFYLFSLTSTSIFLNKFFVLFVLDITYWYRSLDENYVTQIHSSSNILTLYVLHFSPI